MAHPPIAIVDNHDNVIGQATMEEARRKGLLHRIARVMVEDGQGNILLQKRASGLLFYPGRWDNSAAGHVDAGESYETAAAREMKEEIGLDAPLEKVGTYYNILKIDDKTLSRFNRLYKATLPKDTRFKVDPGEVDGVKWFTVEEVKDMVKNSPQMVTDGVVDVISKFY